MCTSNGGSRAEISLLIIVLIAPCKSALILWFPALSWWWLQCWHHRQRARTPSVSTMSENTKGSCWDTSGCLVGTREATLVSIKYDYRPSSFTAPEQILSAIPQRLTHLFRFFFSFLPTPYLLFQPHSSSKVVLTSHFCSNHTLKCRAVMPHVFSRRVVRRGTGRDQYIVRFRNLEGKVTPCGFPFTPFKAMSLVIRQYRLGGEV